MRTKVEDGMDLISRLEAIRQRAQSQAAQTAQVIQLPLWPDPVRGVPNSVLRSALFGAIRRGRRKYLEREIIASVDGVSVRQTGPRLDQADLDVWEQCLYLVREQLGQKVQFAGHSFLRAIGRHTGGKDAEWLKCSLARIMSVVVEIEDGRKSYAGHLIDHWYHDKDTGHHVIEINPKIASLYGSDGWTAIEWQQRLALRSPLAKWLHGFYSSHAEPYPLRVETLHRLCGSETNALYHFRAELRDALRELQEAAGWKGWIDDRDLVHVEKSPTPSQTRHLIRRKKKHCIAPMRWGDSTDAMGG